LSQYPVTRRRRMDPIGLIQVSSSTTALQQERHERDFILRRELAKSIMKLLRVLGPEIWRRFHTNQHNTRIGLLRARLVDELLQVALHCSRVEAAQTVVCAQL